MDGTGLVLWSNSGREIPCPPRYSTATCASSGASCTSSTCTCPADASRLERVGIGPKKRHEIPLEGLGLGIFVSISTAMVSRNVMCFVDWFNQYWQELQRDVWMITLLHINILNSGPVEIHIFTYCHYLPLMNVKPLLSALDAFNAQSKCEFQKNILWNGLDRNLKRNEMPIFRGQVVFLSTSMFFQNGETKKHVLTLQLAFQDPFRFAPTCL